MALQTAHASPANAGERLAMSQKDWLEQLYGIGRGK